MMNKEDKSSVVHGEVFYRNRWMPIEKKVDLEAQDRKKIEEGFVMFQGEWVTIEEKLARVFPPAPQKQEAQHIHVNQTYNIDKRVIHEHEHKHLHLDAETLAAYAKNRGNALPSPDTLSVEQGQEYQLLDGEQGNRKMIPGQKPDARFLEDKSEEEEPE
jgi:hypothetical protein